MTVTVSPNPNPNHALLTLTLTLLTVIPFGSKGLDSVDAPLRSVP